MDFIFTLAVWFGGFMVGFGIRGMFKEVFGDDQNRNDQWEQHLKNYLKSRTG